MAKVAYRSFSNFGVLQHPIHAFPNRDSFLNNDQFPVLHNILNVVGVFLGHSVYRVRLNSHYKFRGLVVETKMVKYA